MQDRLQLDRVAFIGRTYDEYRSIFDLDETLLKRGPILDCASGPSSFSAEARKRGVQAVACDLLYDLPAPVLGTRGRVDIGEVFSKVDDVPHLYVWKYYKNRDEIISLRHKALDNFVADFSAGKREGRYVRAELPRLPFPDRTFSLVLVSHFLFLYGDRLDLAFHVASLKELVRVASGEVRVYPLQGLDAKPYPKMDELVLLLRAEGVETEIIGTSFEFQRGSNKLMKLRRT